MVLPKDGFMYWLLLVVRRSHKVLEKSVRMKDWIQFYFSSAASLRHLAKVWVK